MKRNKQLTVYLSKSLKTPETELYLIRHRLNLMGFIVTEYTGGEYNTKKLDEADFVLVVPYHRDSSYVRAPSWGRVEWETILGKGQFSEVERCIEQDLSKPVFIFHKITHLDLSITVSKVEEKTSAIKVINKDDWKINYGTVASYARYPNLVDLHTFITYYMNTQRNIVHTPIKDEGISFSNLMMLLD